MYTSTEIASLSSGPYTQKTRLESHSGTLLVDSFTASGSLEAHSFALALAAVAAAGR